MTSLGAHKRLVWIAACCGIAIVVVVASGIIPGRERAAIASLTSQGFSLGRMKNSDSGIGEWVRRNTSILLPGKGAIDACEYEGGDFEITDLSTISGLEHLRKFVVNDSGESPVQLGDALLAPLASLTGLEVVIIDCHSKETLTDATLRGLSNSRGLLDLEIGHGSFTDEGVRALAVCQRLRKLCLPHCRLSQGLGDLNLASLFELDVSDTNLDSAGARCLKTATRLDSLNLSGTAITDQDVSVLVQLPSLDRLILNRTGITDDGLLQLEPAPRLTLISALETAITPKAACEFTRAHSNIRIRIGSPESNQVVQRGQIMEPIIVDGVPIMKIVIPEP